LDAVFRTEKTVSALSSISYKVHFWTTAPSKRKFLSFNEKSFKSAFLLLNIWHTRMYVCMHIHRFSLQEIRSPANVFCVAVFYVCTLRRRHMYFVTSRKSSQYENVASFQRKFSSFLYFSLNCEFCKKKYLSKSRKRLQLFVRLLTATSMLRVVMRIRNY
jgi:hypothetical protein